MTKKLTIAALALAAIGCGAPASNQATANEAIGSPEANHALAIAEPENLTEPKQATARAGADAARTIRFANGSTLQLQSHKADTKQGLSHGQCAVTIAGQRIATIGSGELEAYTCGALVEAGALPLAGSARRIGLIYRVSSPNAQFQTALVLVEQGGQWAIDPESIGEYDDMPAAKSLDALAKAVGGAA